jgi:3-methyladenine DNA glycosylase Tag
MERCNWPSMKNSETYTYYHDNEWGVESHDDSYLFEMFVLESFHCGLSWLIILNKRNAFKIAFDNFNPQLIRKYDENKISSLLENTGTYLWDADNVDDKISNTSELSDVVSKDLKKRGFKFMGSVTTLSYLEAIGVVNNHSTKCFKHGI